jgi:ADP-ribose pyrophosphatase YjhB (NUDIX family)
VRRGIEPGKGKLALVGGFVEEHETWQAAAAREVREETSVLVDPASMDPFWYVSTEPRPNRVLLFAIAAPLDGAKLPPLAPNAETAERGLVFGSRGLEDVFAFPLHVKAAKRWLDARGLESAHDFTTI